VLQVYHITLEYRSSVEIFSSNIGDYDFATTLVHGLRGTVIVSGILDLQQDNIELIKSKPKLLHITLHYLKIPSFSYITGTYNTTLPYITLHYLTLPYITLQYPTLPYITLQYPTLPYNTTLPYSTYIRLTLLLVLVVVGVQIRFQFPSLDEAAQEQLW
jgi:hypothetical protein